MSGFYERVANRVRLLPAEWRPPQAGALGAVMAHWSLSPADPTLVSIPTGAGKTGLALAAPFLTARQGRVLVVVPKRDLADQLAEAFSSQRLLHRLGVLPPDAGTPVVTRITGRVSDWKALESCDVAVALPNSVSPAYYTPENLPPAQLFDLLVFDEAHHAPSRTWRALLEHFSPTPALLLTATPRRRDGQAIPGTQVYYYPLRLALQEGFYKPIEPVLLEAQEDRMASDRAIAHRAAELLDAPEHQSSVLVVRAGTVARLAQLRELYEQEGVELTVLHHNLGHARQSEIIERLRAGGIRAIGVVGMLGEGFDLSAIRLLAYHDKHRSLSATAQLIGRLARVDPAFPQPSMLITVRDGEVFPELKGVLLDLYREDADWATLLPEIIDAEVEQQVADNRFAGRFGVSHTEVSPGSLKPLARALVYETPVGWTPDFARGLVPDELQVGAVFARGIVVYSAADAQSGLMVVVVRRTLAPKWSSDPALTDVQYELHIAAFRRAPRRDLPGLVLLNLQSEGLKGRFEEILELQDNATSAGPERLGDYLDSLQRISVSSVGVRSTNAGARGRASYRNFMGSGVDRGLRSVDTARSALGHVMFQITTPKGSANAGGAVEKSKIWLSRYLGLRELSEWVQDTTNLLWFPVANPQGRLLPGMDRGRSLTTWPLSPPLAADLHPALFGSAFELIDAQGGVLGAIEDLELFVNDDPTETLQNVGAPTGVTLSVVGVLNDRQHNSKLLVFEGDLHLDGKISATRDAVVRRGYGPVELLSELLSLWAPTVYFLDGSTTIGPIAYDSRANATVFDMSDLLAIDWPLVDLTAETRRTATERGVGLHSVHERLEEFLLAQPRVGAHRWVLCNDGSGEIADYLVVEDLATGELALGLWHAKGAGSATTSVRVGDFQVVVAQAIRSRRSITSTDLWATLGRRLDGRESPAATMVTGSDDEAILRRRLGLDDQLEGEPEPWTVVLPVVRATIGVVQPGLTASGFRAQLAQDPVPAKAAGLRELFSVLADTAVADGSTLRIVVSE